MIPSPFLAHLARQFKVKWWSNFSPSNAQQFLAIRHWISGKNSPSNPSPSKDRSPLPTYALLLSRIVFPFGKEFIKHLKLLKKFFFETLS